MQAGGFVRMSATGRWSAVGQQLRAASAVNTSTDANGYPNTSGQPTILSAANRGALIGRIGENGTPFLIGATYEGAVQESGMLYLSMNDGAGQFADNSGRLAVSIAFTPPPPPPVETPATTTPAPNDPATTTTTETTPGTEATTTTVETTTTVDPATGQTTTSVETTTTVGASDGDDVLLGLSQEELVRYGLIGAAVLGGLLLLSRLFGGRGGGSRSNIKEDKKGAGNPRVSTRVLENGVATQNLSIRVSGR